MGIKTVRPTHARLACPGAIVAVLVIATLPSISTLTAQERVEYDSEIQPIFDRSCGGGACHIGRAVSGVDLSDYSSTLQSQGAQYGGPAVVPFDAAGSPLFDKLANDVPRFGVRMPRGQAPLDAAEIDLIARWITQGAQETSMLPRRGDLNRSDHLEMTDALLILQFLFLAGPAPWCEAVADTDANGEIDLADGVNLLNFLFLGGDEIPELTNEEAAGCLGGNASPDVEPIGTVRGREGLLVEFTVTATDAEMNNLRFEVASGPNGMTIDESTGVVRWLPLFGQAGDHRVRIAVSDDGTPPATTDATGLVRILEGNNPPTFEPIGTVYAREGVVLLYDIVAVDADGDDITFELVNAPDGAELDPVSGRLTWLPSDGQAGEHGFTVRAVDNGEPPRSSQVSGTVICLDSDSPENQAPFVPRRGIYRTVPGRQIRFSIGASDPDGHDLSYAFTDLPVGASFDGASAEFSWVPAEDQVGAEYISFTVTDSGTPPLSTESVLVFQVRPNDPCSTAICDPVSGCRFEPHPIDEECCSEGGPERVPEPVAECPDGRVAYVGRNLRGFGRIQSCDLVPIVPFPQGGASMRLNIEARCINIDAPVSVRILVQMDGFPLINRTRVVTFRERADGFSQILGLIFSISSGFDVPKLDGERALITATLTDDDGVVLVSNTRVILNVGNVEELPESDTIDVPAGEAGCVGCHRPLGPTGERHGIEDAHPWYPISCVDCHGGDATASTREQAHVLPLLGGDTFIKDYPADVLDQTWPTYLQFVNPSDLRVAHRGCGSSNPANPGSGCHQSTVETVKRSVMSTYAGHYTLPRYLAGSQSRDHIYAAISIVNPDFDAETAPEGSVPAIQALREPAPGVDRSTAGACIDIYLPKSCPTCHLSDFGPNNANGNYRSSGCAACHMPYAEDGLSQSEDPVISKDFPPHPRTHQMTSAIETEQCGRCHFQGGRIGLAYRGIREGGFDEANTPEHGVTLGRELHNHDSNFYFVDEDDRNDYDETPPDLHADAGMVCADCHIGGDVHGDGHLYGSERHQVGVSCEDCHGTVREEIAEDPEDGEFKNSKGFTLSRISRDEENRILLKRRMDGVNIEIPQIRRIIASGVNQAMNEAMGVNEAGFSHTDSMECYTCHTSWRQTCFGCHVTIDDSRTALNLTTGRTTQGGISVSRDTYSTDFFSLGMNHRGKISPLCNSMSVFLTYVDENGVEQYRDRPRTSSDGKKGFGWNPFHHHTVSRVPQNCDVCHTRAAEAGEDNSAKLRETYGFGTGRFMILDGEGVEHDLSAFLDEEGNLMSDFPHPNTGPVPREIRERAMGIEVVPHPRQER